MSRLSIHLEKEKELKKRMRKLKVFEKDIKETFIRSSGPGGQNVNKLSTCVFLHHVPTDIQVKCQTERSQGLNRYKARLLLIEKIRQKKQEEKLREIEKYRKLKRQTRKRSTYLKEEILEKKHRQSEKKAARKKIPMARLDQYL